MFSRSVMQPLGAAAPGMWVERRMVSQDGCTWKLHGCFLVQDYHVASGNNPVMMEPYLDERKTRDQRILH